MTITLPVKSESLKVPLSTAFNACSRYRSDSTPALSIVGMMRSGGASVASTGGGGGGGGGGFATRRPDWAVTEIVRTNRRASRGKTFFMAPIPEIKMDSGGPNSIPERVPLKVFWVELEGTYYFWALVSAPDGVDVPVTERRRVAADLPLLPPNCSTVSLIARLP